MVYVMVRRHEGHVGGEDVLATREAPKADDALLQYAQHATGGRNAVVVTAVAVQWTRGEVAASDAGPAEVFSSSVLLVLVGRVREVIVVLAAYTVTRARSCELGGRRAWPARCRTIGARRRRPLKKGAYFRAFVALRVRCRGGAQGRGDGGAQGSRREQHGRPVLPLAVDVGQGGEDAPRSLVHEPPRAADVERAVAVEAPGLFDLDTLLFG